MNVKPMIYFVSIAEEQSLSAAARRLGVSQPTLSTFLTNLEDELGTDLFERRKKKLYLTDAGQMYLACARRVVAIRDQVYTGIQYLDHKEDQVIKVAGTPLRGAMIFASVYPAFRRRYPNISLEMTEYYTRDIALAVKNGQVDLGLNAYLRTDTPDYYHIPTSLEEIVLAVPAFYRVCENYEMTDGHYPLIDLRDLRDAAFVMLAAGSNIRVLADDVIAHAGFNPTIVFESSNSSVIMHMVRQGGGVGFLPAPLTRPDPNICYFSLSPTEYMQLGLILHAKTEVTEPIRYFAWLTAKLDRLDSRYIEPVNDTAYQALMDEFKNERVILG